MTALMIGISGKELTSQDIENIMHPSVCGVILFTRNYENYLQLKLLIQHIKSMAGSDFLIAVDQEGGRVIRFSQPFSQLPALGTLNQIVLNTPEQVQAYAHLHGWLMASELLSVGVDLSFAPVLDIDNGSEVIGDRAFSSKTNDVISLGRTYCGAMHHAGMKTTGKHFPGHGTVVADSHFDPAVDDRSFAEIEQTDMLPFSQLIRENCLDALMFSHVIYPQICDQAAGYSSVWCSDILPKIGYAGVTISDDLNMKAAEYIGTLAERYQACQQAGIDMTLVCTAESATELLADIKADKKLRFTQLVGQSKLIKNQPFWEQKQWQLARKALENIQKQS
ncbi:beta-N-acetylhexosaminidase [Marinicella sp. W31]|uniref:beta-N-acetylhexosaminidase n=1 Tax=Marinicella sp. W31 TaxID=3023713 RepID=UPI003756D55F